jgi:putative phage-type endonuclease
MKEVLFSDRAAWLEWRAQGVGATDAAQLAAARGLVQPAAWMEREAEQALFWDKLGMGKATPMNAAMRRGVELEESIRQAVEADLGFIAPVCGEREDRPWMRASFDGITLDGEIVEIKVPNRHVVELARAGEVVGYYQPQLAHQAMVAWGDPHAWTGNERVHFCVWDSQVQEVVRLTWVSERLRPLAAAMLPVLEEFWGRVERRIAPVGGAQWTGLAACLAEAKSEAALAEAAKERLRRAVAEGYQPQVFAIRHQKPRATKRVDWEAVIGDLGVDESALEAYRRPSAWVVAGGIKPLPDVTDWTPELAEQEAIAALAAEARLEDLAAQAKALAQSLGRALVGPWGLRVYERSGAIDYKSAADQLGWPQEVIDAHTDERLSEASVALVAKKKKLATAEA